MAVLTSSFLFDVESQMVSLVDASYALAAKNLWWSRVASVRQTDSKKDVLTWIIPSAQFYNQGKGGKMTFDDMAMQLTTITSDTHNTGLEIDRNELLDADSHGVDFANAWASQVGSLMAIHPQRLVADAILAGTTSTCYDGQNFFSTSHPLNGIDTSNGTFSNLLDHATYGIDGSDISAAFTNLTKAIAQVRKVPLPNGRYFRNLRATAIIAPPALAPRVQQLTNAKFISQASGSGGGTSDVEAVIRSWGMSEPIEALELGTTSTNTDGDTAYYILAEDMGAPMMGPLVYMEREPFSIRFFTGAGGGDGVDAILDHTNKIEYHVQGRNTVAFGHPYLLFKVSGS